MAKAAHSLGTQAAPTVVRAIVAIVHPARRATMADIALDPAKGLPAMIKKPARGGFLHRGSLLTVQEPAIHRHAGLSGRFSALPCCAAATRARPSSRQTNKPLDPGRRPEARARSRVPAGSRWAGGRVGRPGL